MQGAAPLPVSVPTVGQRLDQASGQRGLQAPAVSCPSTWVTDSGRVNLSAPGAVADTCVVSASHAGGLLRDGMCTQAPPRPGSGWVPEGTAPTRFVGVVPSVPSLSQVGLGSQVPPRYGISGRPPVCSAPTVEVGVDTGATAGTQVFGLNLPSSVGLGGQCSEALPRHGMSGGALVGSAPTVEVGVDSGPTVTSSAVGLSHHLPVEDGGQCSMVPPRHWKSGGASVSYAPTVEVGVGPGAAAVSQAAGTSLPFSSLVVEDEFDESPPQGWGSTAGECPTSAGEVPAPFRDLISRVREFLELPEPSSHPSTLQTGVERASGSSRLGPTPLVLPRSPLALEVRREQVDCCLRNLGAASARLSLPQRWGFRVDRWYTPEGSSGGSLPLNEELQHLVQNKDMSVTIPFRLATQIEGVLSGLVDITSWVDQVLGAFAGLSSEASQEVFDCLNALAKANSDIMQPSEMLRLRMLMLRRQAVVGCLPKTYGDREKRQLLSSPIGQFLFDGQALAAVEQREQDAAQRALVSQLARGLAATGRGSRVGARGTRGSRLRPREVPQATSSSVLALPSSRPSSSMWSFRLRGSRRGGPRGRRGAR